MVLVVMALIVYSAVGATVGHSTSHFCDGSVKQHLYKSITLPSRKSSREAAQDVGPAYSLKLLVGFEGLPHVCRNDVCKG